MRSRYHFVAGVNRAVHFEPAADLWASIDPGPFRAIPIQRLTCRRTASDLRDEGRLPPGADVRLIEDDAEMGEFDKTNLAAIAHCVRRGAKRIDVYGFDATPNAPDFDGVELDMNAAHPDMRSADRFRREVEDFERLKELAARMGCIVTRIT